MSAEGKKDRAAYYATDMQVAATSGVDLIACRVEAVRACIETVEARIRTAGACGYNEAYVAGMEDILVFHRATLERVRRGEGYHSVSDLVDGVVADASV